MGQSPREALQTKPDHLVLMMPTTINLGIKDNKDMAVTMYYQRPTYMTLKRTLNSINNHYPRLGMFPIIRKKMLSFQVMIMETLEKLQLIAAHQKLVLGTAHRKASSTTEYKK